MDAGIYREISAGVWTVFKKYVEAFPLTEDQWGELFGELDEVYRKNKTPYAREYINTVVNEFARLEKDRLRREEQ